MKDKISTIEDLAALIQGEFLVMGDRMDNIEKRMGSIERKIDGLEKRITVLEERVDRVGDRLNAIERQVDRLEQGQVDIKNELKDIKFRLKRKIDDDEFEKLEKRVMRLEKLSFAK